MPVSSSSPPLDLVVCLKDGEALAQWGERRLRCAIGRGAIALDKREGDGVTPVGRWPIRRVLYRADRLAKPETCFDCTAIGPDDGWCDDPADPAYNRPVRLPYAASHERMTREDGLYDVVVVLGHNDAPVVPGAGSAIFLHVARDDYGPTEGCVALALPDLREVLQAAGPGSAVHVLAP
ncbi:L,D-transpeptidase family protein [Pelagibius marinus]|uniref:L,D-transpeptidase family protein n=1 Tax=Pelagibius marinus TaxID=2762760 RepID=UPI001872BB90|nr:L,D-transpeptidase family protein [Pelagibius marinus]